MSFTELAGEILLIGIGTTCWLAFFLMMVTKRTPKSIASQPITSVLFVGLITAMTYVLGVVTDRTVREIFIVTVEAYAQEQVLTNERISEIKLAANYIKEQNVSMELEEFVRYKSDSLGKRVEYNRSRLRITRAWTLHFFLIGISLLAWNARVKIAKLPVAIFISSLCLVLSLATLYTTYSLSIDHQRNILESFRIISNNEKQRGDK